jgi:glycerophosphoryl diester phosphodiesterase
MRLVYFTLIITTFASCSISKNINNNKSDNSLNSFSNNIIVAHRGAWKKNNLPQNSIASLKEAIKLQYTGSEFDVRMTADDSLVIHHDPTYNGLEIEKTNYANLETFKLSNGEKLPTLREYILAGIENNKATRLICEIKPSGISKERGKEVAEKIVKLVHELKAVQMTVYISFDYDILKKVIELNPKAETQYLEGNKSPAQLKADGISGADYYLSVFKSHPEWIESAKQNHIALNAWTVNNEADMDWLLANGFDFITTNEPELLMERMQKSPVNAGWKLVWSDEFNYNGLPDSSKWNYETGGNGWGNNEKEYYTEKSLKNSFVKDGKLHIVGLKEDFENRNYTSARLTTYPKFSFQYGKVEVMAKLPKGKGTWPAIWMLPNNIRTKVEPWPLCGEIDIMEEVGKDPNVIHTSLHTQLYNFWKHNQYTHFDTLNDVSNTFHLYGIEWSSKSIKFSSMTNYSTKQQKAKTEKTAPIKDGPLISPIS